MVEELHGCDDCGNCGLQTILDADLAPGDYILVVSGYSSSEGEYQVQMNCPDMSGNVPGFVDGTISCELQPTVTGSTASSGSHVGNGASDHISAFSLSDSYPF